MRPRVELEADATHGLKGVALITLDLGMHGFSVWALRIWLGARSRGAKERAA